MSISTYFSASIAENSMLPCRPFKFTQIIFYIDADKAHSNEMKFNTTNTERIV
jgi:hypothetical protein